MTILVDLNQVVYSTIATQFNNVAIDEDLIRHMVLNCLRSYRMKFKNEFGELVIATDSRHYWRRDIFPYYKANRKTIRDESGLPWDVIFESMNKVKDELRDTFPYRFIEVHGAEADDIIAVLATYLPEQAPFGSPDNILILSRDKDFIQLSRAGLKQWDPITKTWKSSKNPDAYLHEHIIKGDKGDGIPNIKADDDSLILKTRAPVISKKFIDTFNVNNCSETLKRNYYRNKTLIDLTCIPDDVRLSIIDAYEKAPVHSRSKLFNYFIKKKLKILTQSIQEF